MEMAKVTSKGQITIPVSIRRRLNIDEGDKLLFIDSPDGVVMINPNMLTSGRAAAIAGSEVQNQQIQNEETPAANLSEDIMDGHSPVESVPAAKSSQRVASTTKPKVDAPPETEQSPATSNEAVPPTAEPPVELKTDVTVPTEDKPLKVTETDVPVPDQEEPPEVANAEAPTEPEEGSLEAAKADAAMLAGAGTGSAEDTRADETKADASQTRRFDVNALLDEIRSIGSNI